MIAYPANATMDEEDRERCLENGVWVTADGTEIPIECMTTSHILNVQKMLRRQAPVVLRREFDAALWCSGFMRGEQALIQVDQDLQMLGGMDPEEVYESHPFARWIEEELARREVAKLLSGVKGSAS